MTVTGYIHAGADFDSERRRLSLLETRYDEGTFRRLARLGPLDGAHCLEVGAGAGSVVRWLAREVGRRGRVVATDIDLRFLESIDEANVEVRRHDIVDDELEEGCFDVVHCRALLLHLPDPARALRRMAAAVRPGGAVLVEDADFGSMAAADPSHPLAAGFDRVFTATMELLDSRRLFAPWFGRRLPGLLSGTGLGGIGFETTVALRRGGTPAAQLHSESLQRSRAEVVEAGVATAADFDGLARAMADPSFGFFDAVSVAAWGRRRAAS
jgi:SAM-dependent methyltransferase